MPHKTLTLFQQLVLNPFDFFTYVIVETFDNIGYAILVNMGPYHGGRNGSLTENKYCIARPDFGTAIFLFLGVSHGLYSLQTYTVVSYDFWL